MKEFKRKSVLYVDENTFSKSYDCIYDFVNGYARVFEKNLFGFINKELVEIVHPQYEDARDFSNGYAIVKNHWDACGAIDETGTVVVPLSFTKLGDFNRQGLATFKFGSKYGAINTNGQIVVEPQFDSVGSFHEGLACIQIKNKWGFVNEKFDVVIDIKYNFYSRFKNGKAFVGYSPKDTFYIATDGKVVN